MAIEVWYSGNLMRAAKVRQMNGGYRLTLSYGNTGAKTAPEVAQSYGPDQMVLICTSRQLFDQYATVALLRDRIERWRRSAQRAGFTKLDLGASRRAFTDLLDSVREASK